MTWKRPTADWADLSLLDTARLEIQTEKKGELRIGKTLKIGGAPITVDHHHLPRVFLEITEYKQHTCWTLWTFFASERFPHQ